MANIQCDYPAKKCHRSNKQSKFKVAINVLHVACFLVFLRQLSSDCDEIWQALFIVLIRQPPEKFKKK